MIRKTLIGLAAASVMTVAAASTASAGVKVYFGAPYFGAYYGGYYGHCHRVIVGWKTVWNGWRWTQVPRKRRVCGYY